MKTAKPSASVLNPDRQLRRSLVRSLAGTGRATKIRYFGLTLTAAGSLTLAGAARADIPPPADYVETCTLANKQTATSECLACAADYNNFGRCSPLLSPYCYSKVCKTWGASAYTELWCRLKGQGAPVPSEILNILSPSIWPLPSAPDGGPTTAPGSCLPYSPPTPAPDASTPAAPDAGGTGGQGGAPAAGGTGGQSAVASAPAAGGTGGQSAVASAPAAGGTGGQSAVASAPAAGGTGGQNAVASAPAAGGSLAVGGSGMAATAGAGGTRGSDVGKPSNSSGCAVGGWLSVRALGPWLLAGLFGVVVTLARRRRR
jgi:hypothetical protein